MTQRDVARPTALRLIAIVITVILPVPLGLATICAGMSAVEGLVSGTGQWMACRLIKLNPARLASSALPGLLTDAACSLAALAGAALAAGLMAARAGTPPAQFQWLALVLMLTPAAVFCWQERRTARSMLHGDLFSSTAEVFGA